jgi:UDP-glucuronate 4-epimerase
MAILLTGAAGFIGSHLTEKLLSAGQVVIGLDNFDDQYDPARKHHNVQAFQEHPLFHCVPGDVRDQAMLTDVLRRYQCHTVVHLAARTGVRTSVHEPALCLDVNINGTLALLEAMRTANVRRLVMASSSSVYGNSPNTPFREDDPASQPLSPYAMSKRSAELLAHTYHHLYGLDISCLRFFTVYGPRQRPEMAISQFAEKIDAGRAITLFGDGLSARNYTHVYDIVKGINCALRHLNRFNIINISGAGSVTLIELVRLIEKAVGREAIIDWQPAQAGDVRLTCADLQCAFDDIGYSPSIPIEEGITRFVQWYRQTKASQQLNYGKLMSK